MNAMEKYLQMWGFPLLVYIGTKMETFKSYASTAWEFAKKYWLPLLIGFALGAFLV